MHDLTEDRIREIVDEIVSTRLDERFPKPGDLGQLGFDFKWPGGSDITEMKIPFIDDIWEVVQKLPKMVTEEGPMQVREVFDEALNTLGKNGDKAISELGYLTTIPVDKARELLDPKHIKDLLDTTTKMVDQTGFKNMIETALKQYESLPKLDIHQIVEWIEAVVNEFKRLIKDAEDFTQRSFQAFISTCDMLMDELKKVVEKFESVLPYLVSPIDLTFLNDLKDQFFQSSNIASDTGPGVASAQGDFDATAFLRGWNYAVAAVTYLLKLFRQTLDKIAEAIPLSISVSAFGGGALGLQGGLEMSVGFVNVMAWFLFLFRYLPELMEDTLAMVNTVVLQEVEFITQREDREYLIERITYNMKSEIEKLHKS